MNVGQKQQRLTALRLQRDHVMAEIAAIEVAIEDELTGHARALSSKRKRPRNVVHVETPIVKHEQDLASWGRRLADVEGL